MTRMAGTPITPFSEIPPIILFVGEDMQALPAYSAHLEHAGMWVASSTSPAEVLLTVQELQPDVIVADVDFSEGSLGLALIDGLAMSDATSAIPLIALKRDASREVPRAAKVRTTLWVQTPVPPEVLVANVQQLLIEAYAVRMRADRDNRRLQELADRSRSLFPSRSTEADRFASATRTCPACAHPLEWIENGRIGTVQYDYYQWCANGCGLHCYDVDNQLWVKLAPVGEDASGDSPTQRPSDVGDTPPTGASAIAIVTDQAGYITAIDGAGAKLINYSARHAIGTSLLPYVQRGRQELIEDLRRVFQCECPARSVVIWPRDRKPRTARVTLRAIAGGVRWTIDAEPVPAIPPRRGRARKR